MKKFLDGVMVGCKKVASKAKEIAVKAKDHALALIAGTSATFGAVQSHASEVAYTAGTGFTGTFDLTPYYSSISIIVAAIAVVSAIKLALNTFKRV